MTPPEISVIVPSYNAAPYLRASAPAVIPRQKSLKIRFPPAQKG